MKKNAVRTAKMIRMGSFLILKLKNKQLDTKLPSSISQKKGRKAVDNAADA